MNKTSMKFRVKDEAHSKAIQEKLFALDFSWSANRINFVEYTKKPFLYASDGQLTHSDDYDGEGGEYFEGHSNPEYILRDGEFVPSDENGLAEASVAVAENVPVKSDGGSSSYYQLTLTNKAGETFNCELGDILRVIVNNDFDLSNIVKACRRASEASLGRGKEGATIEYDMNKVAYFAKEFAHWHKP